MADEGKEIVKLNTDETLEGSSSDNDNSHVNSAENDETVKTFKDLVSFPFMERRRGYFRNNIVVLVS